VEKMVSPQIDQKTNLQNVALLRVLATFSIVVWHSYCSYICWGVADSPANGFYRHLFTRIFPDANMPLFTFIAGYLFCFLIKEKGKYQRFKEFFINKTHRLLIPFLVLGSVINLCEYGKDIVDLLYGTPNHLWYCLMLFYVFIVAWLVDKYLHGWVSKLVMVFSFLFVCYGRTALSIKVPLGLYLPVFYYGFFYAGFLFRERFEQRIIGSKFFIGLIFCVYAMSILFYNRHMILPLALSQIALLFVASKWFCDSTFFSNNLKLQKFIDIASKYSFGIYVLHQWLIWNMTREPHLLAYTKPVLEQHYIIAPIIASITIFSLCLVMTHLLCKTKAGRYFLL
jgi:hypothetical protein